DLDRRPARHCDDADPDRGAKLLLPRRKLAPRRLCCSGPLGPQLGRLHAVLPLVDLGPGEMIQHHQCLATDCRRGSASMYVAIWSATLLTRTSSSRAVRIDPSG